MTATKSQSTADPPANEQTPLLTASAPKQIADKPLPKGQLFLLCFARLVEPVAFFSIFPFLNDMVYEVGQRAPPKLPSPRQLINCFGGKFGL